MKTPRNDIQIYNDGSVCLFTMLTEKARQWVGENVYIEGWQFMGSKSFAVDHRFAEDLTNGMIGDGLVVE